jgi:hypothetical protein
MTTDSATTAPDAAAVPRRRQPTFLTSSALAAWTSAFALVLVLFIQLTRGVMHPPVVGVILPAVALVVSTLATVGAALWRFGRGPGRGRAAVLLAFGLVPMLCVALPAERARRGWAHRDAPSDFVNRLVAYGGVAAMEAYTRATYAHRVETDHLVMYHDGVATPEIDAAAMERHVAAIEKEIGRPLREKIVWVRGTALGQGGLSAFGICLGSDHSPDPGNADDPARVLDRHELAHGVANQHVRPDADVPSFINEGWAECHSFAPGRRRLDARRIEALDLRAQGRWVRLRDLGGPAWYHQHSGPVYDEGHLWVEFVLRRFGVDGLLDFANTCRPETFDADCRHAFGAGTEALEAMLWRDIEEQAAPRTK